MSTIKFWDSFVTFLIIISAVVINGKSFRNMIREEDRDGQVMVPYPYHGEYSSTFYVSIQTLYRNFIKSLSGSSRGPDVPEEHPRRPPGSWSRPGHEPLHQGRQEGAPQRARQLHHWVCRLNTWRETGLIKYFYGVAVEKHTYVTMCSNFLC